MARKSGRAAPARAPSHRQLRVGEALRHALAGVIQRGELRDPDLAGVSITVTEVRVSPDLKQATAFVMPLGGGDPQTVLDALDRAAPFLQGEAARGVRLKFTPRLRFAADRSFDYADRIDAVLRRPEVRRDVEGPETAADDGDNEDGGHGNDGDGARRG
ncbi:MAG: 30S ribosome-binding factor RbfA [Azospirillaceae bacterium]